MGENYPEIDYGKLHREADTTEQRFIQEHLPAAGSDPAAIVRVTQEARATASQIFSKEMMEGVRRQLVQAEQYFDVRMEGQPKQVALDLTTPRYLALMAGLSPNEQRVVWAFSKTNEGTLGTASIAKILHDSHTNFSVMLTRLCEKGILRKDSGAYSIVDPQFHQWLLSRYPSQRLKRRALK